MNVVFVDVDDTLIRSVGTKRIPMPNVVAHVRHLASIGSLLFCWSSGGADYARDVARELDIEECFSQFLPKPNVMIDDQAPSDWRYLAILHPTELS